MATIKNTEPIRVNTDDGWVVVLQHAPWSDTFELWIGKVDNSKFFSATVKEGGYLELHETKEGEQSDPTLRIPGRAWDGLAEALRGVVPQMDKKEVDAELKATKFHLEDMRSLVFSKSEQDGESSK